MTGGGGVAVRTEGTEDVMADQHPVEPDAVIAADRTALARRDAGERGALLLSEPVIPALVRLATAAPVRAATVLALTAVGVAKAIRVAGRTAGQVTAGDGEGRPIAAQVEVTWTRMELRLLTLRHESRSWIAGADP